MKQITFLIISICCGILYAQQENLIINTNQDDIVRKGIELDSNRYCFLINTGLFDESNGLYDEIAGYESSILITDSNLDYIESIDMNYLEEYSTTATHIHKINDRILISGRAVNSDLTDEQVFSAIYDTEFNLINYNTFGVDTIKEAVIDVVVNASNEVVLLCRNGILLEEGGDVFIKINVNLELIDAVYHPVYDYQSGIRSLIYDYNSGYYIVVISSGVICYDSLFNFDTIIYADYQNRFFASSYNKPVSNNAFFVGGVKLSSYPMQEPYDPAIYLLSSEFDLLDSADIFLPDTMDYAGGVDFYSINAVYFGGTHNAHYPTLPWPFQNEDRWLVVQKKDFENQEVKWNYNYGGDGCYRMKNIFASSDGGCVIMSTFYDWRSTEEPNRDVSIIKLNHNGILVDVDETNSSAIEILVFPNPGNDYLILSINGPHDIVIRDFNYQIVYEGHLMAGKNQINTTDFPPGAYLYSIFKPGSDIKISGKWIKE